MNQILEPKNQDNQDKNKSKYSNRFSKKSFFWFQFVLCSTITVGVLGYFFYNQYDKYKNEKVSHEILNQFNITKLYENNTTSYISTPLEVRSTYEKDNKKFSVIGLLEIKCIDLDYPIISTFQPELLKIAPCKFFGPMANEVRKLMYCRS